MHVTYLRIRLRDGHWELPCVPVPCSVVTPLPPVGLAALSAAQGAADAAVRRVCLLQTRRATRTGATSAARCSGTGTRCGSTARCTWAAPSARSAATSSAGAATCASTLSVGTPSTAASSCRRAAVLASLYLPDADRGPP